MPTISAFWGDRQQGRDSAAQVVSEVLRGLVSIDPMFTSWHSKARIRQKAQSNPGLLLDPSSIAQLLRTQRTDFGNEEMPQLGFSFSAWAWSDDEHPCGLSATIGLHTANPNLVNSLVVDLPDNWVKTDDRTSAIVKLLRATTDPDRVVYFDHPGRHELWSRGSRLRPWRRPAD